MKREKIKKLVEAVHIAPSACNSQPWKLILVDEPELRKKVARAAFNDFISFNRFVSQAPLITLGYPPEDYKQRKKIRKPIESICGFNSW